MKYLWFAAGLISLILGVIGLFLPLLPTTPFVILSAFCWSKASPALRQKLLQHAIFGTIIKNWEQHQAIPKKAKYLAITMMSLSIVGLTYRWWGSERLIFVAIAALCCLWVAKWMLDKPDS